MKYNIGSTVKLKDDLEVGKRYGEYYFNEEMKNLIGKKLVIDAIHHLNGDIERVLDEVIFMDKGKIILQEECDVLRNKENESIDEIFRRMFKC